MWHPQLYNFLTLWHSVSQLITSLVEPPSAGFQLRPSTEVTALVRDNSLEECQLLHEIGQSECPVSGDNIQEWYDIPLFLPLDLLQYYQSLNLLSVHVEKEIQVHPPVTSSCHDQPPLQATTATFQVGQGHKGDYCYRVKVTDNLYVAKKSICHNCKKKICTWKLSKFDTV